MIIKTPIVSTQIKHLAYGLNPLINELQARHMDVDAILNNAHIAKNSLADPDYQLTAEQELSFMEGVLETLEEPGFGLEVGQRYHLSNYGILGLAIMTSPNLREAVTVLFENILMTWTYMNWSLKTENAMAIMTPTANRDLGTCYQYMIDRGLTASHVICQEALGQTLPLLEVNLTQAPPTYAKRYQEYFNCQVNFNAESNDWRFAEQYLETPFIQANLQSSRVFTLQCKRICERLGTDYSFAETIRQHILEPNHGVQHLEAIAKKLFTTSRTIQRKLAGEGTSFNAIVEDVLKTLSFEYLQTTDFSIEEIAQRLGYSDAPNFSHAFKRWTGSAPGQYRNKHARKK